LVDQDQRYNMRTNHRDHLPETKEKEDGMISCKPHIVHGSKPMAIIAFEGDYDGDYERVIALDDCHRLSQQLHATIDAIMAEEHRRNPHPGIKPDVKDDKLDDQGDNFRDRQQRKIGKQRHMPGVETPMQKLIREAQDHERNKP